MPSFLNTKDADFDARFAALLGQKREDSPDVDDAVAAIIADVRARGDAAVLELTARFDKLALTPETMAFTKAEIEAEIAKVASEDRAALELAADRIRAYHARQLPQDALWHDATGATLGWRWTPVSAAGLYVPGARLLSLVSSDERHSGQSGGGQTARRHLPHAGGGGEPAGAVGRPDCRGGHRLSHRWRAGGGRAGVWH